MTIKVSLAQDVAYALGVMLTREPADFINFDEVCVALSAKHGEEGSIHESDRLAASFEKLGQYLRDQAPRL